MKTMIIALLSLFSLTTFANRIPVCTMTFSGTSEGGGIYKPMQQTITNGLIKYDYHFEDLKVGVSFNLNIDKKGLIIMVDKKSNRTLNMTYGTLLDGEDETLETYLDINEATYQVDCKYQVEVSESDKVVEPRAE